MEVFVDVDMGKLVGLGWDVAVEINCVESWIIGWDFLGKRAMG